ncbi:metal ABC transporter substrate-binding protein [Angustibacter sp. Root456]|uniref:metal ABC transporter substrate-binding protein n=1 Tax=Angustibacter sp. Root456 TaxID=1736539 RepID=UPI0006F35175|nr:metal ABC transporter substrate-binding protein [Angustibacter sp. Root456]KQX63780.1 ABC transporter substrate-binding protein [Angustibacter sp. Root456]
MRPLRRLLSAFALATAVVAGAAACGGPVHPASDGRLHVRAAFYPLQFVAARIGGDAVTVTNLTRPGGEPHDLELTPRDVAGLEDADLVVYLKGFQPAVDDALAVAKPRRVFDASTAASLNLTYSPVAEPGSRHESSRPDPHFWLDPLRLRDVASALEPVMARADPAHAALFSQNLQRLTADLEALDGELATGLAHCLSTDLVTSHNAFGYLAERYGLHQVGISGLDPAAEPDPRRIADVARYVREHHVRTIYFETLVSPAVARTVASETGARTAVLDPLEGLTDASAGTDYLSVMRANLAQLKEGQPCP